MSQSLEYYFQKPEKFPIPGFLDGITTPREILAKAKTYLDALLPDKGYHLGAGSALGEHVVIRGPVWIGENVEIQAHALIRPYTIIGDNCVVGHASELKRCVMFGGAKVASLAFVGDSVLGASARIGSGVVTANRKFNQSEVTVKLAGARVSLGDAYFGLILGDSSRIGANSVTQPGTHIGPYTWVFPMTNVRGFIPAAKRVYARAELTQDAHEAVDLSP
jgi:bifunctional UDP-N-acetylglucosamine pyrophosphorylase/glucosamine-1-phosphate N-acetyltransferase